MKPLYACISRFFVGVIIGVRRLIRRLPIGGADNSDLTPLIIAGHCAPDHGIMQFKHDSGKQDLGRQIRYGYVIGCVRDADHGEPGGEDFGD